MMPGNGTQMRLTLRRQRVLSDVIDAARRTGAPYAARTKRGETFRVWPTGGEPIYARICWTVTGTAGQLIAEGIL